MSDRYHVRFHGPLTTITSTPDGPWARWNMARQAAIEHLETEVRESLMTLECLRRAGNFTEYRLLVGEMGVNDKQEETQVR